MGKTEQMVKLLKYTPEPEKTVAMAARLCYSAAGIESLDKELTAEKSASLIKNLLSMGHFSPLEHVSFTFGIEGVSRSLLAQITRHRIASFSVKSQRYVSEMSSSGRTFNYIIPPRIKELGKEYEEKFEEQMEQIQEWYDYWCRVLSDSGNKAFEDARFVLPNAAETNFIMTMNARELHHFFRLRCCNRAQWEINYLAWEILKYVKSTAPALFVTAGPDCIISKCKEGEMSCGESDKVRARYNNMTACLEV